MGKPTVCIGKNKDTDQFCGNREPDQRLCFRYMDSTLPLLSKSKISSLKSSHVLVEPGLCHTCSKTTLLVFPRGGSFVVLVYHTMVKGGSVLMRVITVCQMCLNLYLIYE